MAIIKAVSSKASIDRAVDYVLNKEKTEKKLTAGWHCSPDSARNEMEITKLMYGKTGGRTYKHFVQSFAPEEKITTEKAFEIAKEFIRRSKLLHRFEVLIATHKDREHVHTHFIVNSVSYEDGKKFRMSKHQLQEMKDLSDTICLENGLSICEKGKTFEGNEREETVSYSKETYRFLKKAERGEVKSYVQDIALAIMDCREQATDRMDFIFKLEDMGIETDWQDNHKYITFTDKKLKEQNVKQCKIRNNKLEKYYNIDFGKETLEDEFKKNAQRIEITRRAEEQLEHIGTRFNSKTAKENPRTESELGTKGNGIEQSVVEQSRNIINQSNAELQRAEADRKKQEAARRYREAERKRLITEENQQTKERARRKDYGLER